MPVCTSLPRSWLMIHEIFTLGWKYYIMYCAFLAFEVVFVYFFFPETADKTLEELTFCEFQSLSLRSPLTVLSSV